MSRPHIATLINGQGLISELAEGTATLLPSEHKQERGRRRPKPRCELGGVIGDPKRKAR